MTKSTPVTISILQKEYKISCPPEEQNSLIESASIVDKKMREIRKQGKSVGQDRIAIMAALNIAHELLHNHSDQQQGAVDVADELVRLRGQVEAALHQGKQLELE
ncbi:MAG: cell division protein ZapA [Gammaproteobacteria bacterium]|uniref:Cell division protein ZapA n=1 Tax=Candidatus Thiopontia autotrophica TaxID=2841688 RepID=A0A8J6PAN7_9GAMM|nr:cell division protein ZapA [Candidatus Thiopontia autotrophica]MBL6969368.1 cell division protein ZapA [Gammaproteobacteria bacterium]